MKRIGQPRGTPVFMRSDLWVINSMLDPGTEVEFVRNRQLLKGRGKLSARADYAVGE